jgi:DNA-3-methyladenine glycosylase II
MVDEKAIRKAERHLSKVDTVMRRLIAENGPCPLAGWEYRPFHTLVISIISQQLSAKAADTIEGRIGEIVPRPFYPEGFAGTTAETLRSAGLSQSKARYILELAGRVSDGRLSFAGLETADNETVVKVLVEAPGIGRWTAEMFLIFGLKRLDVLSLGDAGLQRAVKRLYGKEGEGKAVLEDVATKWRPYRSVASWYLWQSLEDRGE